MTPPPLPAPRLTIAGDDPDRGHWYASEQMLQYARDVLEQAAQMCVDYDPFYGVTFAKEIRAMKEAVK